jgi:hypothetical protein
MVRGMGQTLAVLGAAIATVQFGCTPDSSFPTDKSRRRVEASSPALVVARSDSTRSASATKELYTPNPADFRKIYDRDLANKSRQKWEEYFSWVKTFYSGNILESGWTKRALAMLEGLRSEQVQDELRASLNELSKLLAGEWSKDNSVRKVDNSDLRSVGSRFLDAKEKDDGTGAKIRKEIEAIRAEIESRFRR